MVKSRVGRCTSAFDRNRLLRRLQACKLSDCSIDEIVDGLRSRFPDYRRYPIQPFKNQVHKTLDFHRQRDGNEKEFRELSNEPAVATPSTSPHRKKLKKNEDEKEERLLHRENEYLRLRTKQKDLPSPSSSSSTASSSSESDDEEESEAVSTSEDVIFDEKFEPEFDLMKSMLRSSYGNSASKNAGSKVEEKNLELEVVNNPRKIDLVQENGRGGSEGKRISENLNRNGGKDMKKSGDDSEGKRVDGPRFRDLGGMRGVLDELMMEVIVPLYHPQVPQWLGVKPIAGILLHGPPGCGKTKLAHAIANETEVPFYKISATEVVSGVSGGSEENIRDLFSKASRTSPSIIFIDEIDAIASKRESLQREMERRIVTQLMTCMDESHHIIGSNEADSNIGSTDQKHGYVLVIGATNRPDALDPALRRRFDREIYLSVPDENARKEILSVLTRNLRLEGAFDLHKIAKSTPGFVGADLATLANKAGNLAMKRIIERRKCEFSREPNEEWWKHPWIPEDMEELSINMGDFEEAIKIVQPSARREGFSSIPNVKWEDVGGLDSLRKEFDRYIVARIKSPEDYEEFGVDLETGFLLYGPPGCGKTLIAKAVANEAGANFIHIKGPELLNKYVGESELAVRTIFSRARMCSPCVLFFDEVDALATKRGTEGGWVVERLLNQLLIELDGADQRKGVFVIGATNRPEVMDRAVLRPGRFGKLLYVPLPGPHERGLILKALARKKPISPDVDLMAIGQNEACENLSGADLAAVINEAAMAALEEKQLLGEGSFAMKMWTINGAHFQRALEKVSPSVSEKQNNYYKVLSQSFRAA